MSKFIEWSNEISVGIEEIDAQHRVLVDLLNEIHEAIQQGRTLEVTKGIVDRLDEYTRVHFAVEESLMRILHYPDYERHKEEHEKLIAQLTKNMKSSSRSWRICIQSWRRVRAPLVLSWLSSLRAGLPSTLWRGISVTSHISWLRGSGRNCRKAPGRSGFGGRWAAIKART